MAQTKPSLNPDSSEWRCKKCSLLLGVREHGAVFIKFKGAEFTVRGDLSRRCPRCSEHNAIRTMEAT